jgi:FkbM family methyltransferase
MVKPLGRLAEVTRRALRTVGFDVVRYPGDDAGKLGAHLLELFERLRIDCVLDVGAHWGEYGSMLRDWGYGGPIVSFEPVAASVARLEEHASKDAAWSVEPVALGSRAGRSSMRVYRASDLASFLPLNDYAARLYDEDADIESYETVSISRLDGIIDQLKSDHACDAFFLKVDAQGSDLDVIVGASGCLSDIRGIQIETSVQPIYEGMTDYVHALETLREHGYTLTGAFPVSRDGDLRIIELDCVFARVPA